MPAPADEPLARCDINLFAADKEWLYKKYGHGWSEVVRKLVRAHVKGDDTKPLLRWNDKTGSFERV